jgi:hypothetical protein
MALLSKTAALLSTYLTEIGKTKEIEKSIDFNILPPRKCNFHDYKKFDLVRWEYPPGLTPSIIVDSSELFGLVKEGLLSEELIEIPLMGSDAIIGKMTVVLLNMIKYDWSIGKIGKNSDGQLLISSITNIHSNVCISIMNNVLAKYLIEGYDANGYFIEGFNEKIIHLFEEEKIERELNSAKSIKSRMILSDMLGDGGRPEYNDNVICANIYMFCEGKTLIKWAENAAINKKKLFYLACKIKRYSKNGCVYTNLDEYILWYLNHHWDDCAQMLSLFYSGLNVPMKFYYTIRPSMFNEYYDLSDINYRILPSYMRHHIDKLAIIDSKLLEKCDLMMALKYDLNINSMYYWRIFIYIITKKFVQKYIPATIRPDRYIYSLLRYLLEDAEKERKKYKNRLERANLRKEIFR